MSDYQEKKNLINEINNLLDKPNESLSPILRRATRLAEISGKEEYRVLFDIHLHGITNIEGLHKEWKDKNVFPAWDIKKIFINDRCNSNDKTFGDSIEILEFNLKQTTEAKDRFISEHGFNAASPLIIAEKDYKNILIKIRSRIVVFLREVEEDIDNLLSKPNLTPVPETGSIELAQDSTQSKEFLEKETILEKLWRFSESNFFWGGGISVVLAAIGLLLSGATKFSIVLLIIGWIVITISIFKHKFFDSRTKQIQFLFEISVSIVTAIILIAVFFGLRPDKQTTEVASSALQPTPLPTPPPLSVDAIPKTRTLPDGRIEIIASPLFFIDFFDKGYTEIQAKKLIEPYIGKWLKVSGEIADVSKHPKGLSEKHPETLVYLKMPTEKIGLLTVAIINNKKGINRAEILTRGENITIFGEIKDVSGTILTLTGCEFVD